MTAMTGSAVVQAEVVSCSPVPASEPEREPISDVQAYVVGLTASRAGVDLAEVVYVAMASWPGSSREISQGIASAALGWCIDQWRSAGEGEA